MLPRQPDGVLLQDEDRHFALCKVSTLIWCENSMNQNSDVLFVFHASCVKLGSHGLELQL